MEILQTAFYGNTLQVWGIALLLAVGTHIALRVGFGIAARRVARFADKSDLKWAPVVANLLDRTKFFFLFVLAVEIGSQVLDLPQRGRGALDTLSILAFIVQAGFWAVAAASTIIAEYQREQLDEDRGAATMIGALGFVVKLVVWSVVLLLTLDNLGIDVTALVAGAGVTGIAVALAVQNILGDLFASLAIVMDKPFAIKDFLVIGEFAGNVEHVGLKTTRIRSLSGEQLVFSNADLLGSRIRNYGRMQERRILFTVGVTYDTPRAKLEKVPSILKEAVEAQENTRFDRSHFKAYGSFSIDFETVYHVLSAEYGLYMDVQQAINLRIHEQFENEGIEFAFPTQTLYIAKES